MKIIRLDDIPDMPVSHNPAITRRVMVRQGDLGPITQFARGTFPPGQAVEPHRHADMAEVFLCDGGRGWMRVDERRIDLRPGVCVVVEPGEEHAMQSLGPDPLVLTYFSVRLKPQG